MKLRRVIEITTTQEVEQQFILSRFPEALWFNLDNEVRFYVNEDKTMEIEQAVTEFQEGR